MPDVWADSAAAMRPILRRAGASARVPTPGSACPYVHGEGARPRANERRRRRSGVPQRQRLQAPPASGFRGGHQSSAESGRAHHRASRLPLGRAIRPRVSWLDLGRAGSISASPLDVRGAGSRHPVPRHDLARAGSTPGEQAPPRPGALAVQPAHPRNRRSALGIARARSTPGHRARRGAPRSARGEPARPRVSALAPGDPPRRPPTGLDAGRPGSQSAAPTAESAPPPAICAPVVSALR